MSNDGNFRAKYKKIPPQQKPAKSTTVATVSLTDKNESVEKTNLKSIMKASAPHLICYNSKESTESLKSTHSSLSNVNTSKNNLVDENGNIVSNSLKESSEVVSINALISAKSRTNFKTAYSKLDLNPGICIKNPVVASSSTKGNTRSKSLNGLPRKICENLLKTPGIKTYKESDSKSAALNEDSESIVRELESKLKSTVNSRGNNSKLKRSKSVKFNLESERGNAESNSEQGRQPANLETSVPLFNEIPNEFPENAQQQSTFAGFFSSLLPASWSAASVNLNPIPAITRSSTGFLFAAYDFGAHIVRTGIQIANSILSDGITITEPREDVIQYNGFTIRTFGRELLLQSLYINYEQRQDGRQHRAHHRRRPLSANSSASSIASCPSCNCILNSRESSDANGNIKMRIVVEVTTMPHANTAEHSYLTNGGTRVVCEGSRWSLIYGSMMEGLVEIEVPANTQPENIAYHGPIDRIIVIDIP